MYEEIKEITPDDEKVHLTLKHLAQLTLLEKCIKETMRKFSIVPLLLRQSPEDVTLKSKIIAVTVSIPNSNLETTQPPYTYTHSDNIGRIRIVPSANSKLDTPRK